MATLRELKGRIQSVASSEKITGAMKMISSAKMHKAEAALKRLKPYRATIEGIIGNLMSSDAVFTSPLTQVRPHIHSVAVVVFGSDDGLCGAYNVNLFKMVREHIAQLRADYGSDLHVDVFTVGKKMYKACAKLADSRTTVAPAPNGINSKTEGDAVKAFMQALEKRFVGGEADVVEVAYMNYRSAGKQIPTVEPLLPVSAETFADAGVKPAVKPYIFEPDAQTIFSTAVPMFLLALLQEVFGQNRASEQAARVMAMQSANDNAQKLQEQLSLEFNKLRQQSITTELLDIVGGQVRD